MGGLFQAFTINLISIQSNKSLGQIYNALIFSKRSKTVYLGQVTK